MHDPGLDEILADPIIRQLMRRDRVDPAALRALMEDLKHRVVAQSAAGGRSTEH